MIFSECLRLQQTKLRLQQTKRLDNDNIFIGLQTRLMIETD